MSSKILVPLLIAAFCIIAAMSGANVAMQGEVTVIYLVLAIAAIFLLTHGREYWWLAVFVGAAFGGYTYVGVKVYAHEVVLAAALAGLLPSLAINTRSPFSEKRPPLPWYFYGFGVYLIVHIFFSIWWHQPRGLIEYGNIARAYFNGLWPLVFVFFFRSYGRTDLFPLALYLLQATYAIRAAIVFSFSLFPSAMVLPGINFLLPGTAMGSGFDDLRWSGFGMCLTSVAILLGRPRFGVKVLQVLILGVSLIALLAGGGRVLLVSGVLVVFAGLVVARNWKVLGVAATVTLVSLTFLNVFPDSIQGLDRRWQRTLSILIIGYSSSDAYVLVEGSDAWHNRLAEIGFSRWSESPRSLLLGSGIRPWDPDAVRETYWPVLFEILLHGAADTGNYESALWAVVAVTGLVGALFCLATLFHFGLFNIRVILRERPAGFTCTAAFLGAFLPVHYLVFAPRLGGFPTLYLIVAAVAYYYIHDQRAGTIAASHGRAVTKSEESTYEEVA